MFPQQPLNNPKGPPRQLLAHWESNHHDIVRWSHALEPKIANTVHHPSGLLCSYWWKPLVLCPGSIFTFLYGNAPSKCCTLE
jgi:hypothetical protein